MLGSNLFSQTLGLGSSSGLGQVDNSGLVPKESGSAGTDATKSSSNALSFFGDVFNKIKEGLTSNYNKAEELASQLSQLQTNDPALYEEYIKNAKILEEWKISGLHPKEAEELERRLQYLLEAGLNGDYRKAQSILGETTPEMESYLNDMISKQNVDEANKYQAGREDTALLRQAKQLNELGMSSSGVLSIGGAGSGSAGAAQVDRAHNAQARQNRQLHEKQQLFRSILGMCTSLAAAGIGGAALYSSRTAAAQIAYSAAGTARQMLRKINLDRKWKRFVNMTGEAYSQDDQYFPDTPGRGALMDMLK